MTTLHEQPGGGMTNPGPAELRASWERQQAVHEPDRELRFRLMLDHVEHLVGPPARVLDLACGPGSITRRVRHRFPAAEVVAIDIDPLLLELARDAFADDRRVEVVARQLVHEDWTDGLDAGFDAVLTATAMHWFPADALVGVYAGVSRLLRPGGVFLNADHIPIAEPALRAAADALHRRHLEESFAGGAESCDQWYDRAYGEPAYRQLRADRERVFAHWSGELLEREGWHVDLLRRNGFERAGAVWRRGNDAILVAVRA